MPRTWLFTRSDESVYVVRGPGHALVIEGPGSARERLEFNDEEALQSYQIQMAERMAEIGWILFGVDAQRRRNEGFDRAGTPDRRRR